MLFCTHVATLYDEYLALIEALDAAGVEYATVGALAVGIWGAPRATKDIDLLVLEAELARAKLAAANCGFLPVWQSRSRRALDETHSVCVVSREALIAMKLSSARPQDLVDVAKLQEVEQ